MKGALRTENDRALAAGMLAACELEVGERESALAHLETAQHLSMRPEVKALLETLQAEATKAR